jgi:hypothetical protein
MGAMLLDELKGGKVVKVVKVLKQAHIELIRSNRIETERYYPF